MDKAEEHEKRSREIADTTRRFLVVIHTGGIGVTFAVASALANQKVSPAWVILPIIIFAVGLVIIGVSLMLAKHRELRRRDAAERGKDPPKFSGFFWRSFTWDIASLLLFIVGVVVGLFKLSSVYIVQ
ncbi:MAG: hypothetical protein ACOYVJ_13010 [Nitrospirota bacterium]